MLERVAIRWRAYPPTYAAMPTAASGSAGSTIRSRERNLRFGADANLVPPLGRAAIQFHCGDDRVDKPFRGDFSPSCW